MDANLVLRAAAAGNLTADATLTAVPIGPMKNPLYLHILVPAVSADDVLDVEAEFLNAAGTEQANTNIKQITAAGKYVLPFFTNQPQLQVKLNATANDTAAMNFGAVEVWVSNSPIS